jgi:hypothetical protein
MKRKEGKAIILSIEMLVLTIYVSNKRNDIAFIDRKKENGTAKE